MERFCLTGRIKYIMRLLDMANGILPTEFATDSAVGRLWADVQGHYLQKNCPQPSKPDECLNRLYEEAHTGYNTTYYTVRKRFYDPAMLLSGEALKYAYNLEEYYPYLAKHGFPLPFVPDDFDPKTTDDKVVQEEIFTAVDGIKSAIAAKGLKPGSPEYQMELIRGIYDWGIKTLSFKDDCDVEMSAWEAFKNKCGRCSEISTIMYAAYRHAGLNPQLIYVIGSEPTPLEFEQEYGRAAQKRGTGHICIGIPVSGRERLLLIDVLKKEFDPPYKETFQYSLEEYVQDTWFRNLYNSFEEAKRHDEMKKVAEMKSLFSPGSLMSYSMNLSVQRKLNNTAEAWKLLQKINTECADDPITEPLIKFWTEGMHSNNIAQIEESIKRLGKTEPRAAARIAFEFGNRLYLNVGSDKIEDILGLAAGFFAIGVEYDERYLANFASYLEVSKKLERYKEAAEFFEAYSQKRPDSVLGHYLAAGVAINYAYERNRSEIAAIIQKAEGHLDAVCRLDDCNSKFIRGRMMEMKSSISMLNGDYEGGIKMLEEAYSVSPGDLTYNSYWTLFNCYLARGRFAEGLGVVSKTIELKDDNARKFWAGTITNSLLVFIRLVDENATKEEDARGVKSGRFEFEQRKQQIQALNLYESIADRIAESPSLQERAAAIYLLMLPLAVAVNDSKRQQKLIKKAGRPVPSEAQRLLAQMLVNLTDQLPKISIGKETFRRLLSTIKLVEPLLKEAGRKELASLYIQLARQYITHGKPNDAKRVLRSATAIEAEHAFSAYFNDVIKDLATAAFQDKENSLKLEAAVTAMELCVEVDPPCPAEVLNGMKNGVDWFGKGVLKPRIEVLKKRIDTILSK